MGAEDRFPTGLPAFHGRGGERLFGKPPTHDRRTRPARYTVTGGPRRRSGSPLQEEPDRSQMPGVSHERRLVNAVMGFGRWWWGTRIVQRHSAVNRTTQHG